MVGLFKFVSRNVFTIALLFVGIIIGGYLTGAVNDVRDFFFPDAGAYVSSTPAIVTGLKGVGELVTAEATVAKTDVSIEVHGGILNAGYYSANHKVIGVIEAGIDFDAIDEDNIYFDNDAYIVTLPPPAITSCRIEHIDQNQYSFTLLAADWDMVRQLAQYDATVQFAQEMIEADILGRAREEAEIRIGDFVRTLTGRPAAIDFADPSVELELPPSCQPQPPNGWAKDEAGAWKRAK